MSWGFLLCCHKTKSEKNKSMSGIIRAHKPTKRREFNSTTPAGVVLNKKDIKSFRPYAMEHKNAEFLYLRENIMDTFDPYIVMENLKVLDLSINQIGGAISFLPQCPFLRHLYLTGNRIDTLNGVAGYNNLETLCLSDNAINSFEGLDALPNLRVLSLNFNNISSFHSFPYLPSLHTLNLVGNPIVDIPSYRSMAVALCAPSLVSIDGVVVEESERAAVQRFAGKIVYCISEGFIVNEEEDVDAAADKFLLEMQRQMQSTKPLQLSSIRLVGADGKAKVPTEGIPVHLDVCLQDIRLFSERIDETFNSKFLFPVQFKVYGNASEAFCVGSMNGWGDPFPLERVQEGNEVAFQTTLYLPAGDHEYRYIVDGEIKVVENPGTSKFGQGTCNIYHVAEAQAPEDDQDTILYIRWMRSDQSNAFVLIDDENSLSYTPSADDINSSLRAEVLAYVKGEFSFLYFDISAPVVAGTPTCTRLVLKGEAAEGELVTVEADYAGGEEGSSKLCWFRVLPDNEEVPLETADPWAGYTLSLEDIGCRIKVMFVPVRSDWVAGNPITQISSVVAAGVPACRSIKIVGQLEEACELTAETIYTGGTEGHSKFQWFRLDDGNHYFPIYGENDRSYKPTLEDVGKQIAVEFTPVSKDGIEGEPCRCLLEQTIDAAPPQIHSITVKGELEEQHVLVAEYEYFGGHSGAHLVQWYRRDSNRRRTAIGRPNSATLTTTVKEVGCVIEVDLTPVRSDGVCGEPVTAGTTDVIRPGHPQVKALQIMGDPSKGNVLEVHVDYFGGEPGEGVVEWSREVPETRHFDVIAKKTKKYVVQHEDMGRMLKVSYTPVRRDGVQGETKTRLIQIPSGEEEIPPSAIPVQ